MKYSGPGSAFMLRIKKQRELKTHLNKKVFHKEASIVFHDPLINNCGLGSSWIRETLGRSDTVPGSDPPEPDYLYVSYFVFVAVFFPVGTWCTVIDCTILTPVLRIRIHQIRIQIQVFYDQILK